MVPVGGPMPVESPVVYLHGPAVYRSVREMFMDLHRPTAVKRNNRRPASPSYRQPISRVGFENRIPFSHHDRFGFLTFCPTNLGTTIRASVHIQLTALSSRKPQESTTSRYSFLENYNVLYTTMTIFWSFIRSAAPTVSTPKPRDVSTISRTSAAWAWPNTRPSRRCTTDSRSWSVLRRRLKLLEQIILLSQPLLIIYKNVSHLWDLKSVFELVTIHALGFRKVSTVRGL